MKETKVKNLINKVYPNSIAEEVGIEEGDILLNINGQIIEDIIEYKFYLADEYLEIGVQKPNGEEWIIEIDKEYDEDLGMEFENPIIDSAKSCQNKCIFCFIDQLPKNMRKTLYFKDDDSRLSFLHGNYITLTNMKDEDIDKIIQYRISPINISVHTTNYELRKKMLNNKRAGNILKILNRLADNNIQMNCQIVLCPNVNDQEELDNTIGDLKDLSHAIGSVAIVPVGLTRYRQGLFAMEAFDKGLASSTIEQVENWQSQFKQGLGKNFVYLSDEFFLLADKVFPTYEEYDGFPQLENGVGMVVNFENEFYNFLKDMKIPTLLKPKKVTIITGRLIYSRMKELCNQLMSRITNLEIQLLPISNDFFGGKVSVVGLITATDIIKNLKDMDLGEKIIIPDTMLKSDEEIFLDDITVAELEKELGRDMVVSKVEGSALIKNILK